MSRLRNCLRTWEITDLFKVIKDSNLQYWNVQIRLTCKSSSWTPENKVSLEITWPIPSVAFTDQNPWQSRHVSMKRKIEMMRLKNVMRLKCVEIKTARKQNDNRRINIFIESKNRDLALWLKNTIFAYKGQTWEAFQKSRGKGRRYSNNGNKEVKEKINCSWELEIYLKKKSFKKK